MTKFYVRILLKEGGFALLFDRKDRRAWTYKTALKYAKEYTETTGEITEVIATE